MPSAEIITIGTEILLGEIVDTNARYIARQLRDLGIDMYRKTTVGDNAQRIAQAIQHAMEASQIIITTGGLGPTVDDQTREAVALALGVKLEFRSQLWEQIQSRFKRFDRQPSENNKRQAYVPEGAIAVENPVGTAPAFIVDSSSHALIALPGVPREMEYLFEQVVISFLRQRFPSTGIIKTRILHTAAIGESQIDDLIGDLETLRNPTIGLSAHSGQVDVRITAKAASEAEAEAMIHEIEEQVRALLGKWIYGADEDKLEEVALQAVASRGWKLAVVEAGLGGQLMQRLGAFTHRFEDDLSSAFQGGEVLKELPTPEALSEFVSQYRKAKDVDVCLGVAIYPGEETQHILLVLATPHSLKNYSRPYGGPPSYAPRWALHHSLDLIRRI